MTATPPVLDDGFPTYPWGCAPDGLLTRRQLRLIGLHPTGEPAGRIRFTYYRQDRTAWLYPIQLARPVHPYTAAHARALAAALRARRTCPDCRHDIGYVIPTRYGSCFDCWTPTTLPATDRAAA